jgi:hypothetical protein
VRKIEQTWSVRRLAGSILPWGLVCLLAIAAGVFVAVLVPALGLPLPVLLVVLLLVAASPILLDRWRVTLLVFLVWLPLEDLIRKLSGNDLRVYFVKYGIYAILLVGLVRESRGMWQAAAGRARLALYALIAWGVIMSVPSALQDWRLPVIGLSLDFLFVPLTIAGYLLARDLVSARIWLYGLALLGAVVCGVGIAQAVLGPEFLLPQDATPGLNDLTLVRQIPGQAPVFRPSGTFVDPGRYISMTILAVALALSGFLIIKGRRRIVMLIAVLVAATAVWVPGGRTAIVVSTFLLGVAVLAPAFARERLAFLRALGIAGAGLIGLVLLAVTFPSLFGSRLAFYEATLNPNSPGGEWGSRWDALTTDVGRGVELGGLVGQGTGDQSLGKQYLFGGAAYSNVGLYDIEGGYAATAVEWGVIGLILWILWTMAWTHRLWINVKRVRGTTVAAPSLVLFAWVVVALFPAFFIGYQTFQNFLWNAHFWLLSGVVAGLPYAVSLKMERSQRVGLASASHTA